MLYLLFLFALVNGQVLQPGKAFQPVIDNKTAPVKPIVHQHKTILDKVVANPKQFVAEVQNLDPAALRAVIDALQDLLTTSEERENTLNNAVSEADSAVSDAANDVADAEDVLTDKQADVTTATDHLATTRVNAENAITEAETALAAAEQAHTEAQNGLNDAMADHTLRVADDEEAESNRGGEIDGLNHEQQVLGDVIAILEGLHQTSTAGGGCSSTATSENEIDGTGIYACEGEWSTPGIINGGIALCGSGTELCDYEDINTLSTQQCSGGDWGQGKFFGTKVSSHGGHVCEQHNDGTGKDDIWGCGTDCSYDQAVCGIMRCVVGNDDFSNWQGFSSDPGNEQDNIVHTSATGGGVMCCPQD